jgi:hypothetical protein
MASLSGKRAVSPLTAKEDKGGHAVFTIVLFLLLFPFGFSCAKQTPLKGGAVTDPNLEVLVQQFVFSQDANSRIEAFQELTRTHPSWRWKALRALVDAAEKKPGLLPVESSSSEADLFRAFLATDFLEKYEGNEKTLMTHRLSYLRSLNLLTTSYAGEIKKLRQYALYYEVAQIYYHKHLKGSLWSQDPGSNVTFAEMREAGLAQLILLLKMRLDKRTKLLVIRSLGDIGRTRSLPRLNERFGKMLASERDEEVKVALTRAKNTMMRRGPD